MNQIDLNKAFSLINENRIVELSQRLIRVPSITGTERDVVLLARDIIGGLGIDTKLYGPDERPILTASINSTSVKQLAFNGHLDTVPTASLDDWENDPFDPKVIDNKLYGRGSSDMKASCAVMIHVLEILKELDTSLGIGVHLVPDEEKGAQHGTRILLSEMDKGNLRRPDWVVIGEKSNLKIRVAERGGWSFKVKFKGRATHTAYARTEGINAITKASRGVIALEKHINKWHPWIGSPVLSVNAIQAGTAGNQVPDECVISVDRRLIPGETADTVEAEVKATLDEAGGGDAEYKYEIIANKDTSGKWIYNPANFTDPSSLLGKAFHKAVGSALSREPELFVEWAGGTDGAYYRRAGIETIGFGPHGEHAHGPNEFVYIDTLKDQAKVYLTLVKELEES